MPINDFKFIFLFHVTKVLFVSYTLLYLKKMERFVLLCHVGEGPVPTALVIVMQ